METIQIKNPLDMHLHLREKEILRAVFPHTYQSFVAGLVMPNLSTPISNTNLALAYQEELQKLCPNFKAFIALYLTDALTQDELIRAYQSGFKILKLYPKGATTNSQNGVSEILNPQTLEILQKAQELGMILSIHAESNGYSLDREYEFLPIIQELAQTFPNLKIIIEHLSDHRSLELIEKYDNVFATLTLHHITLSLDDLLGKGLNPHLFCKPILKTPKDRDILLSLALKAHPKISFGSDSAPHLESKKLNSSASAGIFSAPNLLEQLCELFESHHALDNLQSFVSDNAIRNYALSLESQRIITLEKLPCPIPQEIPIGKDKIIPLNAGKLCAWKIKAIDEKC